MKKKKENEQERAVDVIDFHKREYYLNRECTWLKFNQRVLRESLSKEKSSAGTPSLHRHHLLQPR